MAEISFEQRKAAADAIFFAGNDELGTMRDKLSAENGRFTGYNVHEALSAAKPALAS